ncbi:DUF3566 domain-containing protein [Rudaeicoccus suwonensis]|uniref:Transmembrane protein DUF3566 n=1 Tax=Rudaeicoccus suwonensis TaxID=657409 RepID=A0A561E421_9MICO|nr:DUF3566 domain-containing protein [Rudaeicoccus suwonensis]TWE10358.1 transmembrane protein DUF3566 [Rudaeicoccus suwonensis]
MTSSDTPDARGGKAAARTAEPAAKLPTPAGRGGAATTTTARPGAARPAAKKAAGGRGASTGARPAARSASGAVRRPGGRSTPRRVRLTLSRVDPWSVMKIAFLLSVAVGIAMVVMIAVLWTVLSGMGVFSNLNDLLRTLDREGSTFNILDYIGFGRVVSLSVVIGVIDVILMTALATLGAFLYNICASLVGGVQMTLSDE